jgi:hypothetical protein
MGGYEQDEQTQEQTVNEMLGAKHVCFPPYDVMLLLVVVVLERLPRDWGANILMVGTAVKKMQEIHQPIIVTRPKN